MIISDVEIRLFIGYNCPRVLTPCKVIAVSEDGLYAQRTDIGQGIVGIVHPDVDIRGYIGVWLSAQCHVFVRNLELQIAVQRFLFTQIKVKEFTQI